MKANLTKVLNGAKFESMIASGYPWCNRIEVDLLFDGNTEGLRAMREH